ncbi:DUF6428 family protein [Flavobacterium saccharophilum]|uniref:Uncharacterized protein n=1 Tax=Flavobacterium saccharophilum TaxID=29534 RepID=A0A1M7CLE7_9FLAO|nr:DUF6428 family protein [Flavobacterium saccharophilum]SHL68020.1 hypothetical protein SAMN05444366_1179 [Flavobacterium saccharophilum]
MKLSEIKKLLTTVETVNFQLPNGSFVPEHFHVTEVGLITKNFIDCGGTVRKETVVNFQLWDANDFEHRLKPQKLIHIIELSEKVLGIEDHEIEVEYQDTTIGKYDLGFNGKDFELLNKKTACLAQEQCGVPSEKPKLKLTQLNADTANSCTPGGGCC